MSQFEPYRDNGGTTVAIPGKDFVIAAGDTRMSVGYSIQTRHSTKLCQLYIFSPLLSSSLSFVLFLSYYFM